MALRCPPYEPSRDPQGSRDWIGAQKPSNFSKNLTKTLEKPLI